MTSNGISNARLADDGLRARAVRFLGAGVVNTAFGYALYAALVALGAHPQVALAMQFLIGVIWNYSIHARYVFGISGYGRLPLYFMAYVAVYAFNALLLQSLTGIGLDPYTAQFIALIPTVILSFVLVSHALGVPPRGRGEPS